MAQSRTAHCFLPVLLLLFLFVFFCPSSPLCWPWSSSLFSPAALPPSEVCKASKCIICSRAAFASKVSPLGLAAPFDAAAAGSSYCSYLDWGAPAVCCSF